MKVKVPKMPRWQKQRAQKDRRRQEESNRFKVLEVDEPDDSEDEVAEILEIRAEGEEGQHTEEVEVRAVAGGRSEVHYGRGDIIVDSAADESCWPVGQGDAFPTVASSRDLKLRTANGGEMRHYGEKQVTFRYRGGEGRDPVGLRFQVTDVRRPLLAVRRLVERGNTVVMSEKVGGSYIENKATQVRIPIVKKAGSFVIEAQFVKGFTGQA